MSLTMSSCSGETFTCNSGACIPLANKCNSKIDCEDESDESQCAYLEVGQVSLFEVGHFWSEEREHETDFVHTTIFISYKAIRHICSGHTTKENSVSTFDTQ